VVKRGDRDKDGNDSEARPIKRKSDVLVDPSVIKKKKKEVAKRVDYDEDHNNDGDDDSDAGHICPDTSCDDEVVLPLDTRLDQMFSRFRAMKNEWNQTGRRPQGYQILEMEIHMVECTLYNTQR